MMLAATFPEDLLGRTLGGLRGRLRRPRAIFLVGVGDEVAHAHQKAGSGAQLPLAPFLW